MEIFPVCWRSCAIDKTSSFGLWSFQGAKANSIRFLDRDFLSVATTIPRIYNFWRSHFTSFKQPIKQPNVFRSLFTQDFKKNGLNAPRLVSAVAKSTRAKVEIDSLAYSCLAPFGRWASQTLQEVVGYEWCLSARTFIFMHGLFIVAAFWRLSRLSGKYPVTGSCSSVLSSTNPSFQETTGVADPKPFIKLFDNEPKQHFRFGAAGSCDQIYNGRRMGCHFPERASIIRYHIIYLNYIWLYLLLQHPRPNSSD